MGPHLYLEWQGRNPSTPARVESANILTESNIRDLVRLVDEELDGVAHEQRRNLETIEGELAAVRRWLERLYRAIEITDLDLADLTPRIKEHRERQERLASAAEEARALLSERREVLDDVDPGKAIIRYSIPMPVDSRIPGRDSEAVALRNSVLPTVHVGRKW